MSDQKLRVATPLLLRVKSKRQLVAVSKVRHLELGRPPLATATHGTPWNVTDSRASHRSQFLLHEPWFVELSLFIGYYDLVSTPSDTKSFLSAAQQATVRGLIEQVEIWRSAGKVVETISFHDLNLLLDQDQQKLVKLVRRLDPRELGFTGPFLGLEEARPDIVAVSCQQQTVRGPDGAIANELLPTKYVPRRAYVAYQRMHAGLSRDLGTELIIVSAYRSPAYQALVFLASAAKNDDFDFTKTAKRVALPGYSQHGLSKQTALDLDLRVLNVERDMLGDAFARTPEYAWLTENAPDFGFYLSYPPGNLDGIMYEPWHWQYTK